ncbi:MAG: hypothetical protein C5B53_02705 [Candidatus Melainabacteria bacterium]|nr:MAG: hypothetical protein C5B53_02705 [Candidatus Melainabacteria bacterium]
MWTTAHIRRQLARMTGTKPFSIRAFLAFGARAAVDQAFARLVRNGEVIRVARGLYIKAASPPPSLLEVAVAKAAAFNRTIAIHGSQAALLSKIGEAVMKENQTMNEHVFACSGRTSAFRFGNQIIRFIGTSARKLQFGDSKPGLAVRSLWYLGKESCTLEMASQAVTSFMRSDREDWQRNTQVMPAWMQDLFLAIKRYWQERQRLEAKSAWLKAIDPSLSPQVLRREAFPQL